MLGRAVDLPVSIQLMDRRLALLERRVDQIEDLRSTEERNEGVQRGVAEELDRRSKRLRRHVAIGSALIVGGAGLLDAVRTILGA